MTDFQINTLALDEEWAAHPARYHYWAEKAADAYQRWLSAKDELAVVEAEISLRIRQTEEKKPTETQISQMVQVDQERKDAFAEMLEAKHEYDIIDAKVKSLEHKKKALENLVDLHVTDYYSQPRANKVSREEVHAMERRASPARARRRRSEQALENGDDG